jgi:dUTP pyrophosphatase
MADYKQFSDMQRMLTTLKQKEKTEAAASKEEFATAMELVNNLDSNTNDGFEAMASLLTLTDEHFTLLAPSILSSLMSTYNEPENRMAIVRAMNMSGMKIEDYRKQYYDLCEALETEMAETLSCPKRDFIRQLITAIYNIIEETEGAPNRKINIPIELCHPDAKFPAYAHVTDAGMDVYLVEDVTINPGETKVLPTGIKCAIPQGYELQVRPKSGRSAKSKLRISNTPGTIDAGYRDEIGIIVDNIDPVIRSAEMDENGRLYNVLWGSSITLYKGEKIAQLVLSEVPHAVFYRVESVMDIANDGRNGGFGSTGDK